MKIEFIFLLVLIYGFSTSCSSEKRLKILSTFFDGVPQAASSEELAADSLQADPTKDGDNKPLRFVRRQPQMFLHEPYRDRACDSCHGTGYGNRLLEEPPDLCFGCHDDFREQLTQIHGPVAAGLCTACHNPHRAKFKRMLFAEGQRLCLKCHEQSAVFANEVHTDIGEESCMSCHNPHGGTEEYFLE